MTNVARPPASAPRAVAAGTRLDSLTGLRFLAALLVFCHHTFSSSIVSHGLARVPGTTRLAFAGMSGVTFFFVLSGFVLAWSWDDARSYSGFLGRRLSRIWPLHALVFVVAAWAVLPLLSRPASTLPQVIIGLLLVQAWTTRPTFFFAANGPAWSLSCELFFYSLVPLAVPLLRRRRRAVDAWSAVAVCVVVLAVVPALLRVLVHGQYAELALWVFPPYRLAEFTIGLVAGWAVRSGWRPRWSMTQAAAVLVVAYVAAAETLGGLFRDPDTSRQPLGNLYVDLVVLLPMAALIVAAAAGDVGDGRGTQAWGRLLRGATLQRLGSASFAFYLVHSLVVLVVARSPIGLRVAGGVPATLAALAASVALADVLHRLVERPAERTLRARLARREARGRNLPSDLGA